MLGEVAPSNLTPDLERRVSIAFFAQPFVAAAVALAWASFDPFYPKEIAFAVWIVAIPITGCAAYPAYERLLRHRSITFARTVVAGIACGNIPAALALILTVLSGVNAADRLPHVGEPAHRVERAVALGAVAGAVSASVFWLIAGRLVASRRDKNSTL